MVASRTANLPGERASCRFRGEETRAFHESRVVVKRAMFREDEVLAVRSALERLHASAQTLRTTGDHDGAFFRR